MSLKKEIVNMAHKIMLVCSAGMSTSMLVQKMLTAAKSEGIEATIFATSTADAANKAASENPEVLLLGPQVRFLEEKFKKEFSIPVAVINMQDYGMMRGDAVLKFALSLIKKEG